MDSEIQVFPPHGFVRLTDWMGTELDIVNAARVSFHKESEWQVDSEKIFSLDDPDAGLIRFLLKNRHGTPFEQGFQSMWHIRMPIFVMREWVRHRIGHSVNEESGRYVKMRPDFYVPDYVRTQVGKPGGYTFEPADPEVTDKAQRAIRSNSAYAWAAYEEMLDAGVAREVARQVLPLNLYTEMRWTANARSLMHFIGLRAHPDAMYEIRKYAEAIEELFAYHMPTTYAAFVEAGRVAP